MVGLQWAYDAYSNYVFHTPSGAVKMESIIFGKYGTGVFEEIILGMALSTLHGPPFKNIKGVTKKEKYIYTKRPQSETLPVPSPCYFSFIILILRKYF